MKQTFISLLLDSDQIIFLALLVLSGIVIPNNLISAIFLIVALLLILWGVWEMRMNRFYQVPDINKQTKLVISGPYAYIRNPMYASQLLLGLSIIKNQITYINFISFILLLYIFIQKMNYE